MNLQVVGQAKQKGDLMVDLQIFNREVLLCDILSQINHQVNIIAQAIKASLSSLVFVKCKVSLWCQPASNED